MAKNDKREPSWILTGPDGYPLPTLTGNSPDPSQPGDQTPGSFIGPIPSGQPVPTPFPWAGTTQTFGDGGSAAAGVNSDLPTYANPTTGPPGSGFDLNNQQEQQYLQKRYNYYIYTGADNEPQNPGNRYGLGSPNAPAQPTLASTYMEYWRSNHNSAEITSLQDRLFRAGLMGKEKIAGTFDTQTEDALATAMEQVSRAHDPAFTVDSFIDGRIKANPNAASLQDTTVNRDITQLTDPGTAKDMMRTAMEQYLGRLPTDSEAAAFTAALNAKERANPRMEQTVTHYDQTGATDPNTGGTLVKNQTVTQSGGYNGGTMAAIDQARAQPGAGEYQAVGFMDALMGALKAPV